MPLTEFLRGLGFSLEMQTLSSGIEYHLLIGNGAAANATIWPPDLPKQLQRKKERVKYASTRAKHHR